MTTMPSHNQAVGQMRHILRIQNATMLRQKRAESFAAGSVGSKLLVITKPETTKKMSTPLLKSK